MTAFVGPETVTIVLVVAVVIFGASRLPQLARSLGQAKGEFQKGLKEGDAPDAKDDKDDAARRPAEGTGSPGSSSTSS
jgi:sec-independent protein translocase protein TatA